MTNFNTAKYDLRADSPRRRKAISESTSSERTLRMTIRPGAAVKEELSHSAVGKVSSGKGDKNSAQRVHASDPETRSGSHDLMERMHSCTILSDIDQKPIMRPESRPSWVWEGGNIAGVCSICPKVRPRKTGPYSVITRKNRTPKQGAAP